MIDLPVVGTPEEELWRELVRLARDAPVPWTLIGAQMVRLHGWMRGREQIHPSIDADILVNVRAVTRATSRFCASLEREGYELRGMARTGIGHSYRRAEVVIDVLAPDGVGERAGLQTTGKARTVRVPGGTQALKRTRPVSVLIGRERGQIPVPDLLGGLLVKIRAINADDKPDAQRADAGFLLSLVEDPAAWTARITPQERRWLVKHSYLADPAHACYTGNPHAEDAALAFRRLSRA